MLESDSRGNELFLTFPKMRFGMNEKHYQQPAKTRFPDSQLFSHNSERGFLAMFSQVKKGLELSP